MSMIVAVRNADSHHHDVMLMMSIVIIRMKRRRTRMAPTSAESFPCLLCPSRWFHLLCCFAQSNVHVFLQFSQAEEQYDVGQVGIFMMISFAKVCLLCSFPIARPPRQYTGLPGRLMTGRVGRRG